MLEITQSSKSFLKKSLSNRENSIKIIPIHHKYSLIAPISSTQLQNI